MTPTPPHTLDFIAVRNRYPKAFEKLCQYLADKVGLKKFGEFATTGWIQNQPRELYDFFDSTEVYVSVQLLLWQDEISKFGWFIRWHGNIHVEQAQYPTRAAAEQAAFTAGFEQLEALSSNEERKKGAEAGG